MNLGYEVADEKIVFEDGIFYDLIKFVKTSNEIHYEKSELEFGPIHIKNKDDMFIKMVNKEIEYNNSILEKINGTNAHKKIAALKERNKYLTSLIK